MNKILLAAVIVVFCCANIYAQDVQIRKQNGKSAANVIISGDTGKWIDGYWLGVTYIIGGVEHDEPVGLFKVRGKFEKKFSASTISGLMGMAMKDDSITWVAKLWKKKVKKSECTKGPCFWCQRMGYHMEECVAQAKATGSLKE